MKTKVLILCGLIALMPLTTHGRFTSYEMEAADQAQQRHEQLIKSCMQSGDHGIIGCMIYAKFSK